MVAGVERCRAALKDVLCESTDGAVIQRPNSAVRRLAVSAIALENNDQLGVAEHRYVRVVRACNDLPLTLQCP